VLEQQRFCEGPGGLHLPECGAAVGGEGVQRADPGEEAALGGVGGRAGEEIGE
jgi:hypothetical protein